MTDFFSREVFALVDFANCSGSHTIMFFNSCPETFSDDRAVQMIPNTGLRADGAAL